MKEAERLRKIRRLKQLVLLKVSPNASEAWAEKKFAGRVVNGLQTALPRARVTFVGSAARDTGLKGDNDIDVFAAWPREMREEEIVRKTFEAARKTLRAKWETHYAEHPYLQARVGKYKVEVIPCFSIAPHEGIKSAVDRSPLHMAFLQERLSSEQRKDVRVLKQFLKNAGLYGAELAIQGFSGLLCEYLILNYRTFENLAENAAQWKPPVVIRFDPADSENKKFDAPLVLIDAVDRNRNVAAVVSETNVHRFISLCRAFLKAPSEKFFFFARKSVSKSVLLKKMRERKTHFVLIDVKAPAVVEDILVPQLRRTQKTLERHLQLAGFVVFGSQSFCANAKCFILFELLSEKTPTLKKEGGPPAWNEKAVNQFLKARTRVARGPFVDGARVAVETIAEPLSPKEFFRKAFAKPGKIGVASFFAKPVRKARVLENEKVLQKQALGGIADYLLKREFWW